MHMDHRGHQTLGTLVAPGAKGAQAAPGPPGTQVASGIGHARSEVAESGKRNLGLAPWLHPRNFLVAKRSRSYCCTGPPCLPLLSVLCAHYRHELCCPEHFTSMGVSTCRSRHRARGWCANFCKRTAHGRTLPGEPPTGHARKSQDSCICVTALRTCSWLCCGRMSARWWIPQW